MKKSLLIVVALLVLTGTSIFADDNLNVDLLDKRVETVKIDGSKAEGKLKAGVVLGYPVTGLTAGWRPSDVFELNLFLGTDYSSFTVGASPMFTIVNFNIADEIFPFSIGPAAYLNIGNAFWGLNMDVLGVVRLEYTFKQIPLNLFIESGAGIRIYFTNSYFPILPNFTTAIGARYVF